MITIKARKLHTLLGKSIGLIGKSRPEAVYFETRFGIHTFGLAFPIDVVVLNDGSRVIALKENLRPNSVYFWNPRFKKIVELPAGTIRKKQIEVGELVKF